MFEIRSPGTSKKSERIKPLKRNKNLKIKIFIKRSIDEMEEEENIYTSLSISLKASPREIQSLSDDKTQLIVRFFPDFQFILKDE